MGAPDDPAEAIARFLERHGLEVERRPTRDTLIIRSREPGVFAHEPVVHLPGPLLRAYLDNSSARLRDTADPFAEALSLIKLSVLEELTTDHGDGMNFTRLVALRRGRDGRPEFLVDRDPPDTRPYGSDDDVFEWLAERPSP